jgi:hypothetical protein
MRWSMAVSVEARLTAELGVTEPEEEEYGEGPALGLVKLNWVGGGDWGRMRPVGDGLPTIGRGRESSSEMGQHFILV